MIFLFNFLALLFKSRIIKVFTIGTIFLLAGHFTSVFAQNLIINGSMTSMKGENIVAPSWNRIRTGLPANSPDINDENGNLLTTPGWVWHNGLPTNSPDGSTWQNIFNTEDFSQTINGLIIGTTYYFRYYYTTQGIKELSSGTTYASPTAPHIEITGLSGYTDPSNTGVLFEWNTYYGSLIATSNTATITALSNTLSYEAYDGFYLSPTPLAFPLVISQPQNVSLCLIRDCDFAVIANNATSYQWQINSGSGWSNINDNAIYSNSQTSNLHITNATISMNNYIYRCKIGNSCCTIYSENATLSVSDPQTPSLVITASPLPICFNSPITFSAIPVNGGSSPTYQWKKNAINVGTNSATYTDNTLITGDIIDCVLTSNSNCLTTTTALSNSITIAVNPLLTPAISIFPTSNNICFGTSIMFNSTSLNQGLNPIYQWKKNGINIGTNQPTYIDNTLNNGDIITCSLTSNQSCISVNTVNSNPIVMTVSPLITPLINISTSNLSICSGNQATIYAGVINAGTAPVYQWQKNGINVGTNISSYTASNFVNGDIISCILTSNNNCLTVNSVTSNLISLNVSQNPIVVLDKTTTLCSGSSRTLNAGNFNSYLWNNGSNNSTLNINAIGTYYVTVIDINGCIGSDTSKVTTLIQQPTLFLPKDTSICSYGSLTLNATLGFANYLWSNNSIQSVLTINQAGFYWLEVKDNFGCVGKDSILVTPKQCIKGFYIPTAFSPNNDGKNDYFKPLLFGNIKKYKFIIFNRWGQPIFETSDFNKGWDGNIKDIKQNGNLFIWLCNYQFENEQEEIKKGRVILIR